MGKETRKKLGKDFKEGKTNNYEKHYLEFQKEIDEELAKPISKPKEVK